MPKAEYTYRQIFQQMPALVTDCFTNNVVTHFKDILPTVMVFNVVSWCNSRCIMCDIWRNEPQKDISIEQLQSLVATGFFRHLEIMNISGGEPTLRNDLDQIVKAIHAGAPRLQKVGINSHGFHTERVIHQARLISQYCEERELRFSLRVSLDGVGKVHEDVRRIPRGFEKIVETLKGLKAVAKEHEFSLGISSTLMPTNVYDAPNLQKFAEEQGIDIAYYIAWISEDSFRNAEEGENLVLDEKAKSFLVDFFKERMKEGSLLDGKLYLYDFLVRLLRGESVRKMPCPFANQGLMMDANGDIHYCINSRKIGNVFERPIADIYYDPDNLAFRKSLPETHCPTCYTDCLAPVAARKRVYPYVSHVLRMMYARYT